MANIIDKLFKFFENIFKKKQKLIQDGESINSETSNISNNKKEEAEDYKELYKKVRSGEVSIESLSLYETVVINEMMDKEKEVLEDRIETNKSENKALNKEIKEIKKKKLKV